MTAPLRRRAGRAVTAALLLTPALAIVLMGFVAPLLRLAALSVSSPRGPLAAYRELATVDVYREVLENTVVLALVVSAASLAIGFALAFALTRLPASWRAVVLACVVLPLWISVLVRTFAWMLILERNGALNRFLMAIGIVDHPLSLLFAFPGVAIGMVHVLLPYAVLPIYAALTSIDPGLLRASEGLGASRATTFRRVLLPLSARGLATAATFTFLLSLGFFVTPALLGGPSNTTVSMLIDSFVNDRLDWPLAAAASMTLLALTLAVLGLAGRIRADPRIFGGQMTPAGPWAKIFAALMAVAIIAPVLAVVPLAFSEQSFLILPPRSWSLRWWRVFFADTSWLRALLTSLEVGVLSSLLSVVAGTLAALGLQSLGPRARALITGLFLGPMVAPAIVLAVGLYALARSFDLVGSVLGLVLAHAMLALPYVVFNVGVSVAALDPHLAQAASGLGAGPLRVFRTVTLPSIAPGVLGGGVFAFVTSFDEVVLAVFLSGPNVKTLPVRIWEEVRTEYTPVVAVAATIMIVLAVMGSAAGRLAKGRST